MTDATTQMAREVAQRFGFGAPVASVEPYGAGLINDTYVVTTQEPTPRRFILQRINGHVFQHPDAILSNLRVLSRFWEAHYGAYAALTLPLLIAASDGHDGVCDQTGAVWRVLSFVEQTRTLQRLESERQAHALGRGLGLFHAMLADLPVDALQVTLPGFHVAPNYLAQLDACCGRMGELPDEARACLSFVEQRRPLFDVLERARQRDELRTRVTHGDPKLNNFLFALDADRVVSLIDLDTVQPGLIHNDVGDCVRSACNLLGESPDDVDAVRFNWPFANAIIQGYLEAAGASLTSNDRSLLFDAIRLLPLELGVRFLADHLAGDRYFRVEWRGQNLYKARVQFALADDIERHEALVRRATE